MQKQPALYMVMQESRVRVDGMEATTRKNLARAAKVNLIPRKETCDMTVNRTAPLLRDVSSSIACFLGLATGTTCMSFVLVRVLLAVV